MKSVSDLFCAALLVAFATGERLSCPNGTYGRKLITIIVSRGLGYEPQDFDSILRCLQCGARGEEESRFEICSDYGNFWKHALVKFEESNVFMKTILHQLHSEDTPLVYPNEGELQVVEVDIPKVNDSGTWFRHADLVTLEPNAVNSAEEYDTAHDELKCPGSNQTLTTLIVAPIHRYLQLSPSFTLNCLRCLGKDENEAEERYFCRTTPSRNVSATILNFPWVCVWGTENCSSSLEPIGIRSGPNEVLLILSKYNNEQGSQWTLVVLLIVLTLVGLCMLGSFGALIYCSSHMYKLCIDKLRDWSGKHLATCGEKKWTTEPEISHNSISISGAHAYENVRGSYMVE
eukprot:maker-scaffold969_size75217-snap-gene-0.13 protein:Tk04951 transcript:maker-scaffold969_size75217-snap-gene-0.13-mRNA-1 annotation:"hypothetical protein"